MLRACLSPDQQNRVYCVGVSDRMYNDQQWVTEVQNAVDKVIAVDTVNLASRITAEGTPGTIQVDVATFNRLSSKFEFGPEQIVYLKGKGNTSIYRLIGKC